MAEQEWQVRTAYENGKGRRYNLLFAVNGGAYTLVGFLLAQMAARGEAAVLTRAILVVPIAMIVYTIAMYFDIRAFGLDLKTRASREGVELFGWWGEVHLLVVCAALAVAWLAAAAIVAGVL